MPTRHLHMPYSHATLRIETMGWAGEGGGEVNDEALFSLAALRSARDAAELGDAPAPDDEAPGAESDSEADAAAGAGASEDEDSDDERRRAANLP